MTNSFETLVRRAAVKDITLTIKAVERPNGEIAFQGMVYEWHGPQTAMVDSDPVAALTQAVIEHERKTTHDMKRYAQAVKETREGGATSPVLTERPATEWDALLS